MDFSKLTDEQLEIVGKVIKAAEARGINPDFVLPMVRAESGFNPNAKSPKNAFGVMQLMPATAASLKVDPKDVDQNIEGGFRLLQELMSNPKIGTDPAKIIAAYNANPTIKFIETGDLADLPEETLNHLSRIADYAGGTIPSPLLEKTTEQADQQKPTSTAPPSQEDFVAKMIESIGPAWESMSDDDRLKVLGTMGGAAIGTRQMMTPDKNPPPMSRSPGEKWGTKTGYGLGEGSVREVKERFDKYAPQPLGTQMKAKSLGAGPASLKVVPGTTGALSGNPVVPQPPGPTMGERVGHGVRATGNLMRAAPPVTGALGGYGMAEQGIEAGRRFSGGDYTGGTIAGLGALGSAAMMSRNPAANLIGGGLSMASPAALMVLDKMRQDRSTPPAPPTQQELATASRPYFGTPRP
jgi:hypothetical protein